jgi:L-rhamnose mutarotase
MKVFAQALDLQDDPAMIAEYEEYHRAVWPEVKQALREIGIQSMLIFRTGSRLYMTFEAPDDFDPARDFKRYSETPKSKEWDDLMRTYQRQVPGAPDTVWWMPMEKVFDLNA